MVRIDLGDLRYLYRIVAVMTGWMVRVPDPDLRIRSIALLARELEGDNARDIRLKGQNLQVEHELRVVAERGRNTYRPIQIGRLVVRHGSLGALDLTLHLTHTVEILIQAHAIGNAHPLLEPDNVRSERIEQACPIAQRSAACVRIAAFAEQALEDDSRMSLGRKRRRRRRP